MHLNREWIERHIPHAGKMCLLDEVVEWDADQIQCRSSTHRDADNPLRANGSLGAACGIEYAAQAMAVHGVLVSQTGIAGQSYGPATGAPAAAHPRVGYIASIRGVTLFVSRLDDVQADLIARATRVNSDPSTALYEFSLSGANRPLLSGRVTIVFPT